MMIKISLLVALLGVGLEMGSALDVIFCESVCWPAAYAMSGVGCTLAIVGLAALAWSPVDKVVDKPIKID